MSFKHDVRESLTEIKVELGKMNVELKDHTRRSTNLEERVVPLEQSHVFFNKLSKAIAALAGVLAACATVLHYVVKVI